MRLTHVSHASRHSCEHPTLRVVHCDVEIGDVRVPLLIEKYVIGLQVTVR